jgi:hypothetical protein
MLRHRFQRAVRTAWVILICLVAFAVQASAADDVILNVNRYHVLAGRYSVFADFQRKLQRILDDCGKVASVVVPRGKEPTGRIGRETRLGIQVALDCKPLHSVPLDSPAKDGILTSAVWRAVMGDVPEPTLQDRVIAQVLSYEATDFGDRPEWNLCQDSKGRRSRQLEPKAKGFVCYNASDPCSLVTWGPRGATAGSGREIQLILWMAWKQDPALVEGAFGREFGNAQRFFRLESGPSDRVCRDITPLRRFVCAVWVDPPRRKIWEDALAKLGHSSLVRNAYDRLYGLNEFDGGKLRAFFGLWKTLGLTPNEVDYAFFIDRATHLGGPPDDADTAEKLSACMQQEVRAISRNGAARRCLARQQPHDTQPEFRAARDVGFYLDAYPEGALSEEEIKGWGGYVPLSAVHNFGLSESKSVRIEDSPGLASLGPDLPLPDLADLTEAELKACPATVLTPVRRRSQE